MRVFVTGASGWIGSAVVPELLGRGPPGPRPRPLGRLGRRAHRGRAPRCRRGDLDDLDGLRAGAPPRPTASSTSPSSTTSPTRPAARPRRRERRPSRRSATRSRAPTGRSSSPPARSGSRPGGPRPSDGHVAEPRPGVAARTAPSNAALALADRGVRSSVVRLAPTVHGDGDHGFIATLVGIAREQGRLRLHRRRPNRWPAVHRLDAARLFRLALEQAPAGSRRCTPSPTRASPSATIAEAIGRHLDLPVVGRSRGRRRALRLDRRLLRPRRARVQRAHPRAPGLAADAPRPHRGPAGRSVRPHRSRSPLNDVRTLAATDRPQPPGGPAG